MLHDNPFKKEQNIFKTFHQNMKKILIFSCFFIVFLTSWCHTKQIEIMETIDKSDIESINFSLNFEELTWWREELWWFREEWGEYWDAEFAKINNHKFLTFNEIAEQLKGSEYSIDYEPILWDVDVNWRQMKWTLNKYWNFVGSGNGFLSYQFDWNHLILCYEPYLKDKNWIYCIIDWKDEFLWYSFNRQYTLPKTYKWDIYKVQLIDDMEFPKYWVFVNDDIVYRFEADHPTDTTIQSFIVNDSGRWLFYRTHNYWQEWIFLHIVHNWLDIWEQNNYEDIFWLFNYKDNVLYFFKKNWKIFYNLNWENFDTDYDDIMHDWCCGMGSYNMFFWDWAMLIYAKKDWKYYLIKWAFVED
jgi:hypothetical protein